MSAVESITTNTHASPLLCGRRRVLLLCDDGAGHAETVYDSIDAVGNTRHRTFQMNPRGMAMPSSLEMRDFDAVIIHWSLVSIVDHYLGPDWREAIRNFSGVKIQLIQDDYRWVNRSIAMARYLGIHVLFSVVDPSILRIVWKPEELPGVEVRSYLTGYVAEQLRTTTSKPLTARTIDVGYRGRALPFWLGRMGQEKAWIGRDFLQRAAGTGLRCDIAWDENSRIYGDKWNEFLSTCRACLGTESGSSVIDFDSSIQLGVEAYLREHPDATFEEVSAQIIKDRDGALVHSVISPRIFEAAAARTALILFPGPYSGIVEPWKHYLPLQKDFSNFDEVVRYVRNDQYIQEMTARTHADLIASGKYAFSTHTTELNTALDEQFAKRARARHRCSDASFTLRWQLAKKLAGPKQRLIAVGASAERTWNATKAYLEYKASLVPAWYQRKRDYVVALPRRAARKSYRILIGKPWLAVRDHVPESARMRLRLVRDTIRGRKSTLITSESVSTASTNRSIAA
jgi:hypothetical protein